MKTSRMRPFVVVVVMLAGVAASVPSLAQQAERPASRLPQAPLPLSAAARAVISATLGKDDPSYHARARDEGWRTENPRHSLRADFSRSGVTITDGAVSWEIRYQGVSYGRPSAPAPVPPIAVDNRVEYRRGSVVEWYVNGPFGLEQGFTVYTPPGPGKGDPLVVRLGVSGDLQARLDADAFGFTLTDRDGRPAMTYRGLAAWDATGRELPVALDLDGSDVFLRVDDDGAVYPLTIDPLIEQAKLVAPGADGFAESVAVSGDTVVVGGDHLGAGAVYVFEAPFTGLLTPVAKLTALDGQNVGVSVAISGNTIVAGAPYLAVNGNFNQGAAYVFVKPDGGGWVDMTATTKLVASGGQAEDRFGISVSIDADTIVVGTGISGRTGAAYVFVEPGVPGGWASAPTRTETAKLTASDGLANRDDGLGAAVAVRGHTVVAGAPHAGWTGTGTFEGAAYVFEKPTAGWDGVITETAKLTLPGGPRTGVSFQRVAVDAGGDTVLVGDWNRRAAYVFQKPSVEWTTTSELTTTETLDPQRWFLLSVALHQGRAAVGWISNADSGAVYMYEPAGPWPATMTESYKLSAADGLVNDGFGVSVALDHDTLAVGAFAAQAAYVFDTGAAPRPTLTVQRVGTGTGEVRSTDGHIVCGSTCSAPFNLNAAVELQATADSGSIFIRWEVDCSGTEPVTTVTMSGSKTCRARFEPAFFTLTVNTSGGGAVTFDGGVPCSGLCSGTFANGHEVTLEALANPGWAFLEWTGGDCSGTSTLQMVLMDGHKECTATFEPILVSIDVTPLNPSITVGQTQQFEATGYYGDGPKSLTAIATWTSDNPAVATITTPGGLASGVGVGTSTISVTLNGISGATLLTVDSVTTRIELVASRNPAPAGEEVTITATVHGVAPTGGVTFDVDNDDQFPGNVVEMTATTLKATIPLTLAAGSHRIVATYLSDANNSGTFSELTLYVVDRDASGTAVRGILTGNTRIGSVVTPISPRDSSDGDFARDSALTADQVNVTNVGRGWASAALPQAPAAPLVRGPYVSAWSFSDASSSGAAGARAIAYATVVNPSSEPVQAVASATLEGSFALATVSHASGAVYVFDSSLFLNAIRASGKTPKDFLSGATLDTLDAWAGGNEAALTLVPVIGATPATDPVFKPVSGSNGAKISESLRPFFEVGPGGAVVIVFDLIVYSPAGGFADFSGTLKPAADFLTDPDGNPTPLVVLGLWTPPPPAAANLTLTPSITTSPLGTPVTIITTATTAAGGPVPNTQVFLEIVSGPNAGPIGPAVTDANGQVSFTYQGGSSVGTDQMRAAIGSLVSNASDVTWTAGPLHRISINPANATITAGGSQSYTALAFDAFDNSIGNVTAGTTFGISPDGSCTGAVCTASVAGTHTVTATHGGKTATARLDVTPAGTAYSFTGFLQPIDMSTQTATVWNTVKPGQVVPVKWLLTLNGAPVSDPASFVGLSSYQVACPTGPGIIEQPIEQAASPGGSALQYNGDGNWQLNWRTLASYKDTCRAIVARFSDGSTSPTANFKFR